jgi:hypothetical protein
MGAGAWVRNEDKDNMRGKKGGEERRGRKGQIRKKKGK